MNLKIAVISIVLAASALSPLCAQLKIDFNDNDSGTQPVQTGFTEITGSGGVVTNDYGVDGTVTITLTSGSLDDRDRGALTGGPGLAQSDLLRDFIFRNTGTGLGITLATLKAGEYTFTGFFHDNSVQQDNGTLSLNTGDGRGEVLKVSDFTYSTGTSPAEIGSAGFTFIADGIHSPVVYISDTNTVHTTPYVINGFTLEKTDYPKGPDDLVAYYDFEDRFSDSSGNDNHGVPSGSGVTFVTNTPPLVSYSTKCADFNGTNYVTLPYLGLYNSLAATNGLTISLWIKSEAATTQSWFIAEGCLTNEHPAYVFGHNENYARPTALIRNLANNYPINTKTATSQLFDGSWHHWVWTDINGSASMYIDGVFASSESGTWNYTHEYIPFSTTTLGAWFRNPSNTLRYPLLGQMDDVSIWNTVLSGNQIKFLASGGDPLTLGIINGTVIIIR